MIWGRAGGPDIGKLIVFSLDVLYIFGGFSRSAFEMQVLLIVPAAHGRECWLPKR